MARALTLRILALAVGCLLVEALVRFSSVPFGGARVLVYGTPWYRQRIEVPPGFERNIAFHQAEARGYTKYFPHEEKWVTDSRGLHRVRINNHGLLGPDYDVAKAPGVRRVLTLGASSTFGFENRDDETYPFYLQRLLDRMAGPGRYEVINFAIPHAASDEIVTLFLAEGLSLSPDVVTIYEGINDSKNAAIEGTWSPLKTAAQWSLAAFHLQSMVEIAWPPVPKAGFGDAVARRAAAEYLGSLDVVAARCREHGIRMIAVTQQARSLMVERPDARGLSFAEEMTLVRRRLGGDDAGNPVPGTPPLTDGLVQRFTAPAFVTHGAVMQALARWAAERDVPLVDGIAALDRRRDLVVTWVHLTPLGNKLLARALAPEILRQAPPLGIGAPPMSP